MVIGSDVGKGPLHGGVESGGDQGVLKPVPLGIVVVDIVACDYRNAQVQSQSYRGPCELGVTLQEVALHFHVDRVRPEPLHVLLQQEPSIPTPTLK